MMTTTLAPVSVIADVLALRSEDGWLTPPLQPVVPSPAPVVGRALTITVEVGPTGPGMAPIYDVLSRDLTDRVIVLAGAATVPGAVWGEILTRAALQQRATAVVIDGWVRDRPAVADLGLPIYARGEGVVGPLGLAHIIAVEATVSVNGAQVAADDVIVVDATGCVRVRASNLEAVMHAAQRYAAAEDLVVNALKEGETLDRAYRHKKTIIDELRR